MLFFIDKKKDIHINLCFTVLDFVLYCMKCVCVCVWRGEILGGSQNFKKCVWGLRLLTGCRLKLRLGLNI